MKDSTDRRAPEWRAETGRLTRDQVVDRIVSLNPTATRGFLEGFDEPKLSKYLEHLTEAQKPRGRDARWSRPGDAPSIMERHARR